MNYWYAPKSDPQRQNASELPTELIAAIAAPWRSTKELEAIHAKARRLAHYDVAGAAQDVLVTRQQQESKGAVKALRRGQLMVQLQTDTAALEALTAVEKMWSVHLEQLRREASAAVRALQEKHEDALTKMRLEQVMKAKEMGIRPERRSKELLNLRRSESVLAANNNFHEAAKVKAHADELAAAESSNAHMAWLLKSHGEQERLLARQRKELEALRNRLDERLQDVRAARDSDMRKLEQKIKVTSSHQQRCFTRERNFLEQALKGDTIDTTTTRIGRTLADALPTLAEMAMAAAKQQPLANVEPQAAGNSARQSSVKPAESTPSTGYLGPSGTSPAGVMGRGRSVVLAAAPSVRFAPTPPREAWAAVTKSDGAGADSGSRAEQGDKSDSGTLGGGSSPQSRLTTASSSSSSSSSSSNSRGLGSREGSRSWSIKSQEHDPSRQTRLTSATMNEQLKAEPIQTAEPVKGPSSSAAVGSGTTAAATGSGSSALTEEALRAMNQATGVRLKDGHRGTSSLQSSSFKSNKPYAGGVSARTVARPISAAKA
ncbi:hypothetical protein VaNZ11_000641 [Volvox africanus]|uniref:Uncharacterized protein n=1 Tax=Volvox africanus TaxID=51714 RepID=A0ABQ5RMS8_9CHLO|nr:hypothetical protein VaNZ11_000641 [Volvox africanus]